jgi:hypothetical protein
MWFYYYISKYEGYHIMMDGLVLGEERSMMFLIYPKRIDDLGFLFYG